jgi:hypothetical protein
VKAAGSSNVPANTSVMPGSTLTSAITPDPQFGTAKHGLPRIASVLVCFEFALHFDGFGRERHDRLKS